MLDATSTRAVNYYPIQLLASLSHDLINEKNQNAMVTVFNTTLICLLPLIKKHKKALFLFRILLFSAHQVHSNFVYFACPFVSSPNCLVTSRYCCEIVVVLYLCGLDLFFAPLVSWNTGPLPRCPCRPFISLIAQFHVPITSIKPVCNLTSFHGAVT